MELKEFRMRNGLSQMDMASKLKVSMNAYILWERGINTPTETNQKKIDELLKMEKVGKE